MWRLVVALATVRSGGSGPAIIVDTGMDVPTTLRSAFGRVASNASACAYELPAPSSGALDTAG